MKITPITCPACGAALRVHEGEPIATCSHCEMSVMIEWPEQAASAPAAEYRITDPSSPIAVCPHCAAQTLRSAEQNGKSVKCTTCGKAAVMPGANHARVRHCRRHDRMYMSYRGGCPECSRERDLVD